MSSEHKIVILNVQVLHAHESIRAKCEVGVFLTEKLLQFAVDNCWLRDAADHKLPITIDRDTFNGIHCCPKLLIITLIVFLGFSTLAARSSFGTVGSC